MPGAVEFPSLVAVSVVLVLSSCVTAAADGGVPLGVPSAAEFSPGPLAAAWPPGDGDVGSASPPAVVLRVASDAAAVPGSGEPSPVTPWFPAAGSCHCCCCADCVSVVTPEVAGSPGSADLGKFIGPVGAGGSGDGGAPPCWFNSSALPSSYFERPEPLPSEPWASLPAEPSSLGSPLPSPPRPAID
ncbi:hypothetical protein TcCL_Unassigned01812 [Trypanosoma cruzi]|nr:hypothetical protein TcCL_Unassigned01812 [Trypanosoma cruzi]